MKKLIALLTVAALMLSLASCAVSNNHLADDLPDTDVSESTPDVSTPDVSQSTYAFGVTSGTTWENAFLGLGADLPAGWSFYTDEQIRQVNNLTLDVVGDELASALEQATNIFDMMASDGGANNVNVVLQQVGYVPVNMSGSLQATIDATVPALQNAGYTDVSIFEEQQTMCGKTYNGLRTTATIQGIPMNQRMVFFQQGKYLVGITCTSVGEDITQTVLDTFYTLD